jgi:hypothetical protein
MDVKWRFGVILIVIVYCGDVMDLKVIERTWKYLTSWAATVRFHEGVFFGETVLLLSACY